MKIQAWKPYVWSIFLTEAVGALAGWLTREGSAAFSEAVAQPPLSPPAILFPIVWGILYALMGIGAARVYIQPENPERNKGLNLFIVQLVLNFFWSFIFFNAQAYGLAFWWLILLWVLVIWMCVTFWKTDSLAGALQIPYILWLTFAAYLSFGVCLLNRG